MALHLLTLIFNCCIVRILYRPEFFSGHIFTTAQVMFITGKIAFIFTSLSAVHIYDFHIFTVIYSSLQGIFWNQHKDQLPVGLLAQLVEHCIIAQSSWVQILYRPEIFSGLIFTTAQQCSLLQRSLSYLTESCCVAKPNVDTQIWLLPDCHYN